MSEDDGKETLENYSEQSLSLGSRRAQTSGSLPLRVYSSVWQIPIMRVYQYQVPPYAVDLPVYNIWILTSLAFGGATSTSSILRGSPAPQQTAALHLMVVPAVDDIEEVRLVAVKNVAWVSYI